MKNSLVLLYHLIISIIVCSSLSAQITEPRYWVQFTDKNNTPYSVDRPEEFLSQRAIERRTQQNIEISEQDLPVDPEYIDSLVRMGFELINVSKWFNGATFSCNDPELIDALDNVSFIAEEPILVRSIDSQKASHPRLKEELDSFPQLSDYGPSYRQIGMLKGDSLHTRGFEGQNMLIAILDAGFDNANTVSSLQHIYESGRVLALRDFVKDENNIYASHPHGTVVFSIIGGIFPSILYGSATKADFILVRTEEQSVNGSENLIEEYNWVTGAEFADSMGANVINSSLGYSLFDDPTQDHSYQDMDGKTTPISIGANIAASKGILVVSSAGNSAGPPWFKITAPADADSILAIGAVDSATVITTFSSRGPSFDGRVKPDVCAMGFSNISQHPNGNLVYCSGTSCSAPVITGLATCLWQAHPEASNLQVVEAIITSSNRYLNPDSVYGYGIPDFFLADKILSYLTAESHEDLLTFRLYPNPVVEQFNLEIIRIDEKGSKKCIISYIDLMGRNSLIEEVELSNWFTLYQSHSLQTLSSGMYMLRITYESLTYTIPFMKVR